MAWQCQCEGFRPISGSLSDASFAQPSDEWELGVACACATDHPAQNIDRALSAIPSAAPPMELWSFAFGTLVVLVSLEVRRRRVEDTTSPAALQRFLF